jgi:hypothetical protein
VAVAAAGRGFPAARRSARSSGTSEPGLLGFWAGGWLLGLPAWGLLLSRWTRENPLRPVQLLKFLGLLVLGQAIFTFNVIYPFFSLGLFLLPIIPLIRLAYPEYRSRTMQAAVEFLLAVTAVVAAFAVPTPEGSWASPWTYAGGAVTGLMIWYWVWSLTRPASRRPQFDAGAVF